jgi:hypothetical protein
LCGRRVHLLGQVVAERSEMALLPHREDLNHEHHQEQALNQNPYRALIHELKPGAHRHGD